MTREKMTSRMKGLRSLLRGLALACAALVGGAAVAAPSAAELHELKVRCESKRGTVSGAGKYAAGKKVTVKAMAAKGYVFAGWKEWEEGSVVVTTPEGDVDFRTPTYPYVMPDKDISLIAKFAKEADDEAHLTIRINGEDKSSLECKPKIPIPPVLLDVSDCTSLPTVKVTGLPPGLKFTAKKLLNRDGSVLAEANTIYGTPTKSGSYETSVIVTTVTKKTATETVTFVFIDRTKEERVLKIVSDASQGKVTGAGVYAFGTKVTLKATPNKGFLFAGWYEDPSFTSPLDGSVDHRTLSFPYETGGADRSIYAKFVPVEEDKALLTAHLDGEDEEVAEVTSKPKDEIDPVVFDLSGCASLPMVKVTGLPPGLKFTAKRLFNRDGDIIAKANTIYGTPTKSGVYTTTVTVTTAGKKTATKTVTFVVFDSTKGERVLRINCNTEYGKVSGAGVYAPGKKVTIKATPAKGYVFAGWHDEVEGGRLASDVDSRTPTCQYVMPSNDAVLFARFIRAIDDDADLLVRVDGEDVDKYECAPNEAIRPIVLDAYYCTSLPTVTVKGLPPGLKFTAKKLIDRNGAVIAEANTIYGTATKSGVYETTITVTTAGKSKLERRFPIAVDNLASANSRLLVEDTSGSAVALKNARGEKYTVYAGVSEHDLPTIAAGDAADKLTLSGLPAGLKFTAKELRNRDGSVLAKANTIYGVPTKAGFYTVTATVRSGRDAYVSTFTVEVVALPAWAIGTFVGTGDNYEIEPYATDYGNLYWTFTVAANGKISGKAIFDTLEDRVLTATFSTPSLRKYEKGTGNYYCDINLVFKDKGKVVHEETRMLTISALKYEDYGSYAEETDEPQKIGYAQLFSDVTEEFRNCAYQNVWKVKGFKNLPQFAARKTVCSDTSAIHGDPDVSGTSTLTLEIAPNGTVNATLVAEGTEKGKAFRERAVAKGDLIIWDYEPKTGFYLADVCLVFGNMGLLVVEVEMEESADGTIKDTGCEITSYRDIADWSD